MPNENSPAVFTPDNEPYLGSEALRRFDLTIVGVLKANRAVASASRQNERLTELQLAACEIIPQGISVSLSIRELIRQGYLLSAMILIRPLMERAAIISYLVKHPASVEIWKLGWPHGKRPSLSTMLDSMGWEAAGDSMSKEICSIFNHLVHGDPFASEWNITDPGAVGLGYSSGRITDRPDVCDILAGITSGQMLVLMALMAATFPGIDETVQAISETVNVVVDGG